MKTCFKLLALLQLMATSSLYGQSFNVAEIKAQQGQTASGYLATGDSADATPGIPITIINGTKPGPVLTLIAGIHGAEYAPMLALHEVRSSLDPKRLSGTVVMVHIANLPAFQGRTIYRSPVDNKNLNREFPGTINGTLSQRIAYQLTQHVIERSDYVVDLHAGDGNEALRPFVYLPVTGDADLDAKSRQLALAFGLDHIVLDHAKSIDANASAFVDHTAISRGVPAITTETGQLGSSEPQWVALATQGIWNVLRALDMLPGEPVSPGKIVWLDNYKVIRSDVAGVFEVRVKDGYFVAQGTILGVLKDHFGDPIKTIHAPFAGVVNYVVATPPINKGDPLAMISQVVEDPQR